MPQYLRKNTPLAGLERQKITPPAVLPCGGGVCCCIPERLEAGAAGYQELVCACFYGLPHPALLFRIRMPAQQYPVFACKDAAHCQRMRECLQGDMARAGQPAMAGDPEDCV